MWFLDSAMGEALTFPTLPSLCMEDYVRGTVLSIVAEEEKEGRGDERREG